MAQAVREVEARNNGQASDSEIADEMGVTLDEYHSMLAETASCQLLFIEDAGVDDDQEVDDNPASTLEDDRFREALTQVIEHLPERERLVMALYYQEELNLKEVGLVLDVSESRVSQIHSQALTRIRAKMSEWR
jgi:RNA polymerase sigma factor for flagellar operon FliA